MDNKRNNIKTGPYILIAVIIAACLLLFAAAIFVSPSNMAKYANDKSISEESAYFLWLLKMVLCNAGAGAALLSIAVWICRRPASVSADLEKKNPVFDLFTVSFLILFMELALIRWIPAYVKLMAYFTNFILLASMLGMGLGSLAAGSKRNFLKSTPALLASVVVLSLLIYCLGHLNMISYSLSRVGNSEHIYFGGELSSVQGRFLNLGITTIISFVFMCVTMIFIGPGQALGRMFNRFDNPVKAYTVNIGASIAGIVCFSAMSFTGVAAWVWFVPVIAMLIWLIYRGADSRHMLYSTLALIALSLVSFANADRGQGKTIWSPYYKITYLHPMISVNEIGHQLMYSVKDGWANENYPLPYVLNRDAGGRRIDDVLVIGAGSGNDVSHALLYGARNVDAVDIDPSIINIGKKNHPDHPYSDSRVSIINDDGRSYLRSTDKKYDVIVYGLVDSLTLMSNFSSVRLENYLFTKEAFMDVKRHLKPGGVFVMYNYFRWNWLTARLNSMLEKVYGQPPVLILLPPARSIDDKAQSGAAMSIFMAGDTKAIRSAFDASDGEYSIPRRHGGAKYDFNGFVSPPADRKTTVVFNTRIKKSGQQQTVTDDWPFVYLKAPKVPAHNIWGLVAVAALAIVFVGAFTGFGSMRGISMHFFFLGGAFMLLETESIVRLALIHGSTWFVNSVVFVAVLSMVLIANLWVLKKPVKRIIPVYLLLFVSLAANYLLPVEVYLGQGWLMENVVSGLMLFVPIAFAGVIFSSSFRQSSRPALDLGSNLLGVIAGGIAEYASLAYGYNILIVFAAGMYLISLVSLPKASK